MLKVESEPSGKRSATCPQCRGRMVESEIEVMHAHAGLSLKVRDVPAWVCRACGKRLVTNDIAERINHLLDQVAGKDQGRRIQ